MQDEKIFEIVELARETGKIRKGVNETTKSVERNNSELVITANDVDPKEITMHLPSLCEEKKITCISVEKKSELGRAAGLHVPTSALSIVEAGEAEESLRELKKGIDK